MKIVIVNFSETKGGAAKAARRLHLSLLNNNINSTFLTQFKQTQDESVIGKTSKLSVINAKLAVKREEIPIKKYTNKSKTPFSASLTGTKNIVNQINKLKPDIVHLHWINAGMLSIKQISKIKAKIVWSLHDMWAFTGGCHYTENCTNYKEKCGSCPILKSNIENDISRKIYLLKQKLYSNKKITFVGLSKWMTESAKSSSLLKEQKIINIPNPIDTKIFKPISKIESRKELNLPLNKKIVLFGAMDAESDPRKGYKYIVKALEIIKKNDIELAIFGTKNKIEHQNFKINNLGFISDETKLNLIYNSADVMLVPSVQENLSNAIVESMSTGTPVVAFNIGGNPDMIDHLQNGYLAQPFSPEDLANGIEYILTQQSDRLNKNARKKIESTFNQNIVANKYISLYNQILKND